MTQIPRRLRSLSRTSRPEICELVHWSNAQWSCGRSFASSDSSDTPKVRKVKKWVPKDERKALVESSVNRYRGNNSGKFPTALYVQKNVGGCYYVVRKMVQELEYKSKISSSSTRDQTSSIKELAKKNEVARDAEMHKYGLTEDTKEETPCGSVHEIVVSNRKAAEHQPLPEYPSPKKQEDVEVVTPCESVVDIDAAKSKTKEDLSLAEPEKCARDLTEEQTEEKIQNKSSIWGNLKSVAEGIFNFWRKR